MGRWMGKTTVRDKKAESGLRKVESGFDDKITAEAGISEELYLYDIETIVNLKIRSK